MPLFNVSVRHGRTREDAKARLATAVEEIRARFGAVFRTAEWAPGGDDVIVKGIGFVVGMKVDDEQVHVSGDVPVLGALLGKSFETGVKQIVDQAFAPKSGKASP